MEINLDRSCLNCFQLRKGCFVIGCYDIAYGHVMVLSYLASMYIGYFHTDGIYNVALWLDFVFTIVQLLGGAVLVYGIKYKTVGLVVLGAVVGVVLMLADVVGDVLLAFSFPNTPLALQIVVALVLITFIGIRGYMTFCIFSYYLQLKDELRLARKMLNTVPDIIQISIKQSSQK